jgi:hypothetical protein
MEEQDLKNELMTIDDQMKAIVVNDAASYEFAGKMIIELDQLKKKIQDYWKGPKEAAYRAHKEITAKETEMLKPVSEKRYALQGKVSVYLTEQDRIRREAQRKLDEERRQKEEAERRKLEAQAARAEEKGKPERAESLREQAGQVFVAPAIVQPEVDKTTRTDSGTISQRKDLVIAITNPKAIIQAVADGILPMTIVKIDEVKLKQYIKIQGIEQLAGCTIQQVVNAQFRGAK